MLIHRWSYDYRKLNLKNPFWLEEESAKESTYLVVVCAGEKYESVSSDDSYRVYMRLKIRRVSQDDFGSYQCVAKNSLGETDGTIKLYGNFSAALISLQKLEFMFNLVDRFRCNLTQHLTDWFIH